MSKFNYENELLLIANSLMDRDYASQFIKFLDESSFIVETHKTFYKVLKEIISKGLEIDEELIVSLSKNYNPPLTIQYLTEIREYYPNKVKNFEEHLKIQKREAFKYKFYTFDLKKLEECKSIEEIEQTLSELRRKTLLEITSSSLTLKDSDSLIKDYVDVLDRRINNETFYTTGLSTLDENLVVGFAPGGVTTIAGRAGMGKSALIANMLYQLSRKEVPVAHFTLEMTSVSVLDRIVSLSSLVPLKKIIKETKYLTKAEFASITNSVNFIKNNQYLFISDEPRMKLSQIATQVEKLKSLRNFEYMVVFIDLFGQIIDIDPKNTAISYETLLRETKLLARELNVHFVLVAQINRKVESGRSIWKFRPSLDDLKHSGGWEEVSDIVLLLFRAKYYDHDLEDDILEINIAKQREGEAGVEKYFMFNSEFSLIANTDLKPYDKRF